MARARLLSLTLTNFKSYRDTHRVDLAPLTVILGRNNGGKSTLIQALLLLKQTLADPNRAVKLRLDGLVDAISLRELTWGWPDHEDDLIDRPGPIIELEWESTVNVGAAQKQGRWPDPANLAKLSKVPWLADPPLTQTLRTRMEIRTVWGEGSASVEAATLLSVDDNVQVICGADDTCLWRGQPADELSIEWDHFIPYLSIDRTFVGPRNRQRAWHNTWLVLFAQPLEDLKELLGSFQFLGSTRQPPPSLYRPATVPPRDIGVSGEYAAQLLHRRREDIVHYLPPLRITDTGLEIPDTVLERPLVEAVNHVLRELSIVGEVKIQDIKDVGFKLLFGNASLGHVGRGLTHLLPVVQLGLILDPLELFELDYVFEEDKIKVDPFDRPLNIYLNACTSTAHFALEEPESHLHPKVQSRLAHWLVSLAMCNRRMMVETHSDHLVRRLRGLIARSAPGSELESWLLENVVVLEVNQAEDGSSSVVSSRLTRDGSLSESWPADFMDEGSEEDTAIFEAALAKKPRQPRRAASFIHDEGDEDEP